MSFVSMYKTSSFETQVRKDLFARWKKDVSKVLTKNNLTSEVSSEMAIAIYKHLLGLQPLTQTPFSHLTPHFGENSRICSIALALHVCMDE